MSTKPILVAVMGATATGKSDLAEALATRLGAVLINADAFQVYRGMDVGTAKPSERSSYELIDVVDPNEEYGLGEWLKEVGPILTKAHTTGKDAVVVGGTGLYIRALTERFDKIASKPAVALRKELNERLKSEGLKALVRELKQKSPEDIGQIDLRNPIRVMRALEKLEATSEPLLVENPYTCQQKLILDINPEEHERLLVARIEKMVQNGWVDEVTKLLASGYSKADPGFRAIGYGSIVDSIEGITSLDEAIAATTVETRQYAKRQRTWLRKEPGDVQILQGDGESGIDIAMSHIEDLRRHCFG